MSNPMPKAIEKEMGQDAAKLAALISRLKGKGYKVLANHAAYTHSTLMRKYEGKPYYIHIEFADYEAEK